MDQQERIADPRGADTRRVNDAFIRRFGAWAEARNRLGPEADPAILDKVMPWKLQDPKYLDRSKEPTMQRQWTIEARADFSDKDKNDQITKAIKEAAVHVHAV